MLTLLDFALLRRCLLLYFRIFTDETLLKGVEAEWQTLFREGVSTADHPIVVEQGVQNYLHLTGEWAVTAGEAAQALATNPVLDHVVRRAEEVAVVPARTTPRSPVPVSALQGMYHPLLLFVYFLCPLPHPP